MAKEKVMPNLIQIKEKAPLYFLETDSQAKLNLESMEENFSQGLKSIAFASTHYKNSQEKFIALAADFFNKKFPTLKIVIVTLDLRVGALSSFIEESKIKDNYLYEFSNNLCFLDWNGILTNHLYPTEVINEFDMIFWDLPDSKTVADKSELFRTSFEVMDALYLISMKNNNFDDEEFKREIFRFYLDHGLDIRTILPWKIGNRKRKQRSKLSQFIFNFLKKRNSG